MLAGHRPDVLDAQHLHIFAGKGLAQLGGKGSALVLSRTNKDLLRIVLKLLDRGIPQIHLL